MFKKKTIEEDNLILLRGECDNCGAPLKYNKETYECKCDYCGTEYYVTQDGVLEGQLIKIKIHGVYKEFYIGREEQRKLYSGAYRDMNGQLHANYITTKMKIELIEI